MPEVRGGEAAEHPLPRRVTRTRAQELERRRGRAVEDDGKNECGIGVHPRSGPPERNGQRRIVGGALDVELAGRHGVERQAGAFELRGDGGGGGVDDPRGQLTVARAAGPDDGRVARGRGRGGGGQAIERLTARAISKEAGDHARERLERVLLVQHGRHGGHAVVVDSLCHA